MKQFKILLTLVVLFSTLQFVSCSKKDNTPVDQIVVLLDNGVEKVESINSMAELTDVKNIVSANEVWKIIQENSNYELTKGDKEKLKKSYNKLVEAAYKKSSECIPSDEYKKTVKNQLDLLMEGINRSIDSAKTLGEIKGFN